MFKHYNIDFTVIEKSDDIVLSFIHYLNENHVFISLKILLKMQKKFEVYSGD